MTQFDVDGNNDALPDTTLTIKNKAPDNEASKTLNVTVSSAGILAVTLTRVNTSSMGINGFDLVPVPEPTTLLILLAGAGYLARRRQAM